MVERQEVVADVIKSEKLMTLCMLNNMSRRYFKTALLLLFAGLTTSAFAQSGKSDTSRTYKKRVLDNIEIDLLASYYTQDGQNAAVSGGIGTEELTDLTPTIVVSIPLNADDVLTIDAGISAYTSASSSNVDPFDGAGPADPFQASSGASKSDTWTNVSGIYSHSSDDRNNIWTAKVSLSTEYDYTSIGFGGSYAKLFNEKNTEININGNVYIDSWSVIYPRELQPFGKDGNGLNNSLFKNNEITGNVQYNPNFTNLNNKTRNSYSFGVGLSQILSRNLQGSISLDLVKQDGLLSTPFQRVYFQDVDDSFIDNFHLADDIERLPDSRFKTAIGGRLNYFINEYLVIRSYYRYYTDDWGVQSHTASVELPIKITNRFTFYPSYRYYTQTAADYFAPYNQHLSSESLYTSDYDLSAFNANQYGFGVSYTDIFTKFHVGKFGLKSVDLKFNRYDRDSGLGVNVFYLGAKFVID
jgi:hypothetical protein